MNTYGPSEASVCCIHTHVAGAPFTRVIGRPLPDNRVYILNDTMRTIPISVERELFISSLLAGTSADRKVENVIDYQFTQRAVVLIRNLRGAHAIFAFLQAVRCRGSRC